MAAAAAVAWRGLRAAAAAEGAAAKGAADGFAMLAEYRSRGHLRARLDPLKRCRGPVAPCGCFPFLKPPVDITQALDGWEVHSVPRVRAKFGRKRRGAGQPPDGLVYVGGELSHTVVAGDGDGDELISWARSGWWPREHLRSFLEDTYCGTIGFQMEHLPCPTQRRWWRAAAERPLGDGRSTLPDARKRLLLSRLLKSALFEKCLGAKYTSSKRFGLDGCEALIPGLFQLCQRSAEHGVESVQLGMAHRGRLNVLSNLLGKPMGLICAEMTETLSDFHVGDVKYHLGISGTLPEEEGVSEGGQASEDAARLQLQIAPNPSHLEAVGPVVLGQVRALQDLLGEEGPRKVMGIIIHGDAAFAGLGVCYEAMQLMSLEGYSTGGTVHVVLDNQIGFTTEPHENRSGAHASDFAAGLGAPVLHVNADDVEAVDRVFTLAADWRWEFRRDVIVTLVGYRRMGHNELDDPEVTQPFSYSIVKKHPSAADIYVQKLVDEGVVEETEVETMKEAIIADFMSGHAQREAYKQVGIDWLVNIYGGNKIFARREAMTIPRTGLHLETLRMVAEVCCTLPEGWHPHPRVAKIFEKRIQCCRDGGRVDFATAEMLAFGSTLLFKEIFAPVMVSFPFEHRPVRLSGQDSKRGTFNQRHASVLCHSSGRHWVPLASMMEGKQAKFSVFNSPLSEMAVLAFEYGYSLGNPDALVCWEAQFGDFANNAQVAIDQFIASGEEKWGQTSAITLLLPHGYDGQGPDHSSARLERFLQLVNDDPDHLPGATPKDIRDIDQAFDVLDVNGVGKLEKAEVIKYLGRDASLEDKASGYLSAEEIWYEMNQELQYLGASSEDGIDRADWRRIMQQWYRRSAEVRSNLIVLNVSTPAQYFHALRRQAHSPFKKPLIIMAPKYLLHHAKATSDFEDFGPGTFFRRVIVDYNPFSPEEASLGDNTRHLARSKKGAPLNENPQSVRRLILCSGQMYYTLSNAREIRKIKDVAIVRLEQIAPFPHDLITETISHYPNADVIWCQEEPKNMGAWFYVRPRLRTALRGAFRGGFADGAAWRRRPVEVEYVGRAAAAATATGSAAIHQQETRLIVDTAFAF